MRFDLYDHTILLTISGSRAYGMHRAGSDVDVLGVAIPPERTLLGLSRPWQQADHPDQIAVFHDLLNEQERAACAQTKLEGSVYTLSKLVKLAADCNPNVLDVLFCRDAEVRLITPLGERLRSARDLFLSARARHAYAGYAAAQLKRIRGHRAWLLDPPKGAPTRADFGLPEHSLVPREHLLAAQAAVQKQVDRWEIDYGTLPSSQVVALQARIAQVLSEQGLGQDELWASAARWVGLDDNLIQAMQRERGYQAARRHWKQYRSWLTNRNPDRAALEARHGYDTKHAAHLIRLLRMGREILSTGRVNVWRHDADELLAIRAGAWTYEQLIEHAEAERAALNALDAAHTAVPAKVDLDALDDLLVELLRTALR